MPEGTITVKVSSKLTFFRAWITFLKFVHAFHYFSDEFIWSLALSGRSLVLLKVNDGHWFRYRPNR